MAINKVPEMLNEARVYWDGEDNMIGIANVDLPEMSSSTTGCREPSGKFG